MNNEKLYNMILNKYGSQKVSLAWILKDLCITILAGMFAYEDLPESIKPEFIERFLIVNGSIAGWRFEEPGRKYSGELIVSIGGDADQPDVYGIGERYIAVTQNGFTKSITKDVDGVVIYNNSSYTSDIHIINIFVDGLVEMFTSLNTNILYSRNKPVFKATTDKERAAIKKAFEEIKNDLEPIIVTSTNIMEEIETGADPIKVLDITDVNNANKLQYIVKTIDDAFRWFFTLYGQAMQGNGKMAQQTVKEIDGSTSLSFIYPNNRLLMRQEGFERFNKLFGTDIKVRYSDAWLTESIKYKKEADIDNDEILIEPEPDGEAPQDQPDEQPEDQPDEQPEDEKEDEQE